MSFIKGDIILGEIVSIVSKWPDICICKSFTVFNATYTSSIHKKTNTLCPEALCDHVTKFTPEELIASFISILWKCPFCKSFVLEGRHDGSMIYYSKCVHYVKYGHFCNIDKKGDRPTIRNHKLKYKRDNHIREFSILSTHIKSEG